MSAVGIGWRPEIDLAVERLPGVDFVEVIADGIDPGRLPTSLRVLRERGVPVVPHGVGLSLGGAERPDPRRLAHLAACARALDAPGVSEHVAFVRAGAHEAGHLLPVPRTREAVGVVAENVRIAQDALGVPLALENIAPLFRWPDDELTESQFLAEILERTGAHLLLDVANLHTLHVNLGIDPADVLDALPLERIAYVHVAGGVERDGVWHDTHTHPVTPPILEVLGALAARTELPAVLLERDGDYPAPTELAAELATIRAVTTPAGARDPRSDLSGWMWLGVPPGPKVLGGRSGIDGSMPHPSDMNTPTRTHADGGRGALAGAQGRLVAGLAGADAPPEGFDAQRLAVQRAALARKRADAVRRHSPVLAEEVGERFLALFEEYARTTPKPPGGSHADAEAFTAYLRGTGVLAGHGRMRALPGVVRGLVTAGRRSARLRPFAAR